MNSFPPQVQNFFIELDAELRDPLTVLTFLLQSLLTEKYSKKELQESLKILEKQVRRMEQILTRYLQEVQA